MKSFVDSLEIFINEIAVNGEFDKEDLYDPAWKLGLTFWDIASTCNFQSYLRIFVFGTYTLNNIHNNLQ